MFHDLIRDLEQRGHEIIITSRPLANTIELLDQRGLKHTVVGEHYGKNLFKKIFGYPIRVWQLRNYLKPLKPDLAISQSSFHSPVVAKLLGIPAIYTNDNEHAMGNRPAFLFADTILIPENLVIEKVARLGVSSKKVIQYPGVKEGIYLWGKGASIWQNRKNLSEKAEIYIRPEPQTAQYYKGKQNFLDETIVALKASCNITILPRTSEQQSHYKQAKFIGVHVPDKPLSFDEIAAICTLFIGAGGSMTREMAILGIPTISVYQDELLDVDGYLLQQQLMRHEPNLNAGQVQEYLQKLATSAPSTDLLNKGKKAYQLFIEQIEKYKS